MECSDISTSLVDIYMCVLEIESTQRQSRRGQEAGYKAKRLIMLSLRVDSFVVTRL